MYQDNNGVNQNNFNMQSNGMNNVPLQNNQVNQSVGVNSNFQNTNLNQSQMNNTIYPNNQFVQNDNGNDQNNMQNKNKGNKKILLIVLLLIIVAAIVVVIVFVIGNKDNNTGNGDNNLSNNNSQVTDDNVQDDDVTDNNVVSKAKVLQIPTKEIYFTYPDDYSVEQETKTLIIRKNEELLVGIFYDWQTTFDGNLEEIISTNSSRFLRDISSYSKGYLRTSNIEIKASNNTSVGNYDALSFTGIANNEGEWDCHVYGYTFVVEDVKLMVIGLVSTQEQDADMIAKINDLTDQVAASVRTEK